MKDPRMKPRSTICKVFLREKLGSNRKLNRQPMKAPKIKADTKIPSFNPK